MERPSDHSNIRRVYVLCGIFEGVRSCGRGSQSKLSRAAIRSAISKQPLSQGPVYLHSVATTEKQIVQTISSTLSAT